MQALPTLATVCCLAATLRCVAEIQVNRIEYKQGETTLQGLSVYDDAITGRRPGVLVAHQWKGLGDYERRRAEMLAKLGYNVFAVDIYGKGVRPSSREEAAAQAGKFKADRALLKARVLAGFEILRRHALTDPKKVAAIGYCFGGTTVLELARSGADLAAVVSFHGGLATPHPEEARSIKARVLALHGADDPAVPLKEVEAFEEEMRNAGVDWQLVVYGGAVHAFTDWSAGDDNSKGAAYNERADKRSWEAMQQFFLDVLSPRVR